MSARAYSGHAPPDRLAEARTWLWRDVMLAVGGTVEMPTWGITVDCRDPGRLGVFWADALGYVAAPPPAGWADWGEWFTHFDVPAEERHAMGALVDPTGRGPSISFLKVPEPKLTKNRIHIDLKVSGGRHVVWEQRWPLVLLAVERLTAAGARIITQHDSDGRGDHVVMADPEGNEFCIV